MENSESHVPRQLEFDFPGDSIDYELEQLLAQYYIDLEHERQKVLLDIDAERTATQLPVPTLSKA